MKLPMFGVHSVVSEAWRVLKTQPKYIALFILAIILVKVVEGSVTSLLDGQGWAVASTLWGILTSLLDVYVGILTIVVSLKLLRGVRMTLAETWYTDKQTIMQYFLATVVYGFMVLAGYILLIVPGVILQLTYSLVTFLVVDKGMKVREALAESHRLTTGNRWKILQIGLVLGLINLAGALVIGIGLLVTIPLSMLATAVIYTQLSNEGVREPMKRVDRAALEKVVESKKPEAPPAEMNQYQI